MKIQCYTCNIPKASIEKEKKGDVFGGIAACVVFAEFSSFINLSVYEEKAIFPLFHENTDTDPDDYNRSIPMRFHSFFLYFF